MDKPHRHGETLQRDDSFDRLTASRFDVVVVGGGINGAVAALSLSAHGLKVGIVEADDFASGTSQESSNMIWGGFKYLESYDIGLVAGLCRSRNRLAAAYPTQILETRFMAVLEQGATFAPWFAALGANAYWGLGRFHTARPRHRNRSTIHRLEPAVATNGIRGGIEYSDYLLADNDSRFVSEMIIGAEKHGAVVANYAKLESAEFAAGTWKLMIRDQVTDSVLESTAQVLVNTAGPEVPVLGSLTGTTTANRLVFSKGVHLTVPQVTDSGRILAFFDDAERLFYILPMGHRSVIGTTDTSVDDP
ncbi:MAG: FAD-dependent oxidoreductase, partial [Acidimicrobiales bacterium]|nr:FAD-dependent oxidoreductase [Acidimicrobiales bacterium]